VKKRSREELLIQLEKIIGSSCYNGNIQKDQWGRALPFLS